MTAATYEPSTELGQRGFERRLPRAPKDLGTYIETAIAKYEIEPSALLNVPINGENTTIRAYKISQDQPELYSVFIQEVANGYRRYGLEGQKTSDLKSHPHDKPMDFIIWVGQHGEIHATVSLQYSNSHGTQAGDMFRYTPNPYVDSHADVETTGLHQYLSENYGHVVEIKNLSMRHEEYTAKLGSANIGREMILLNSVAMFAARGVIEYDEHLSQTGEAHGTPHVIAVMPPRVAKAANMAGIPLDKIQVSTLPVNEGDFPDLAFDFPRYFVDTDKLLEVLEHIEPARYADRFQGAMIGVRQQDTIDLVRALLTTIRRQFNLMEGESIYDDSWKNLVGIKLAPLFKDNYFTPREMKMMIAPQLYLMPANELEKLARSNLGPLLLEQH